MIGGDRKESYTSRLRFEGCRQALLKQGIHFDDQDYQGVRFSYQDGYRATQALLSAGRKFTAIFAAADVMAIGAIRALWDNGLRVPEDVSVMGLDGLVIGEYTVPKLASVCQNVETLVQTSLDILLDQIEHKTPARHITVPVYMEWRESARHID